MTALALVALIGGVALVALGGLLYPAVLGTKARTIEPSNTAGRCVGSAGVVLLIVGVVVSIVWLQ